MPRFAGLLALTGALVVTACGDQPTSPPPGHRPSALIFDANHGGDNKEVFFLPPLVPNPSGSPFFKAGEFNPNLTSAVIRVCTVVNNACGEEVASFGAGQVTGPITIASDHYLAVWHTDDSSPALEVDQPYRIEVFPDGNVAGEPIAWADVAVVNTGKELKNLNSNEVIGLVDGRTLPIKVRFQNGVRCASANCAGERVTNAGGTVVLETGNGALLFSPGWLPPGLSEVTVTLQRHATGSTNDCVGNAAFTGPGLVAQRESCLEVTTDPVITPGPTTGIQQPVFVYLCTEADEEDPFHEFLQIIKADDGRPLQALKDVSHQELLALGFEPSCEGTPPPPIGLGWNPVLRLASRGLGAIARPLGRLLEVKPLYAIDLGQGGELSLFDGFSYFTLGVQGLAAPFGTVPETAPVGTTVSLQLQVTSLNQHEPGEEEAGSLAGIDVTFTVTEGDGGLTDPDDDGVNDPEPSVTVQTNSDGVATVDLAVASGTNGVEAVAEVNGDPVTPAVLFEVTGTDGEPFEITTLLTGLEYPKGLWIKDGVVYLTETAGRNTSFGGAVRLLRWFQEGEPNVLIEEPENSDGVVVDEEGRIYLTSYHDASPGSNGKVSVVEFSGEAWVETHLLDLEIASHDMFIDASQDIYIIGSDEGPTAKNLYRLPFPDYAEDATVLHTGLGRARSLTLIGSTIYYSVFIDNQVRRFTEGNELFIDNATVLSLTSDGNYLYYSEGLSTGTPSIKRKHLATGAIQTIATPGAQVNTVRYDAATGRLFFLEAGTVGNEFQDGTLKSILVNPPIP